MSITGIVENGAIKLPPGIHLTDGTTVRIELQSPPLEMAANGKDALAWIGEFVGCLDTLPEDFAVEHDHYIHGTPKRAG